MTEASSFRILPHPATEWLQTYCLSGPGDDAVGTIALRGESVTEAFPGALPYMPWHAAVFRGRRVQVKDVLQLIRTRSFVAVLGGSGSGKSSLIFAGILPILLAEDTGSPPAQWVPVVFKPDLTPRSNLAHNLTYWFVRLYAYVRARYRIQEESTQNEREWFDAVYSRLGKSAGIRRCIDYFHEKVDALSPAAVADAPPNPVRFRFLLVVDQFEEVFTQSPSEGEQSGELLISRISEEFPSEYSGTEADPPFAVLLSMRSEYLERCQYHETLIEAINSALYILPTMDQDVAAEALDAGLRGAPLPRNVEKSRYRLDPSLVAWLRKEFSSEPLGQSGQDAMALAQVLLRTLWLEALLADERQFPLSSNDLERLARLLGLSPESMSLDSLFMAIVTDGLRENHAIKAHGGRVSSHERKALESCYPLCAVADVAFLKFSKRAFTAEAVSEAWKPGRLRRREALGAPQVRDLLMRFTQRRSLLPVLRCVGAEEEGVFELVHEAFVRRFLPIRTAAVEIGLEGSAASLLIRRAAQPFWSRWGNYVRNFYSVSLLRLAFRNSTSLHLIAERASDDLRRANVGTKTDAEALRSLALRSLLVPTVILVVGGFLVYLFAFQVNEYLSRAKKDRLESGMLRLFLHPTNYSSQEYEIAAQAYVSVTDKFEELARSKKWDLSPSHSNFANNQWTRKIISDEHAIWKKKTPGPVTIARPATRIILESGPVDQAQGASVTVATIDDKRTIDGKPLREIKTTYDRMLKPAGGTTTLTQCPKPGANPGAKDTTAQAALILILPSAQSAVAWEAQIWIYDSELHFRRTSFVLPNGTDDRKLTLVALEGCIHRDERVATVKLSFEFRFGTKEKDRRSLIAFIPRSPGGIGPDSRKESRIIFERLSEFCEWPGAEAGRNFRTEKQSLERTEERSLEETLKLLEVCGGSGG
ncbi:MAG TPA: hypothetical protein PK177_07800 [Burkholderiaceae bacterium]|nr:hypothetical protein [Burkholderiaceae bacterium]